MTHEQVWPALILRSQQVDDSEDLVSAVLTDFSPVAIHDLAERPLAAGRPVGSDVSADSGSAADSPALERLFQRSPASAIAPRRRFMTRCRICRSSRVDLPDEDWAARSQQSLTAVHAGAFIVAPPWDLPADAVDATVIVIEPSMGFGTGHHATTRMCLRLLSEIDVDRSAVLDLGTGSGVLSMAAALMGARRVIGIDVDQDAIDSAEASARLNTLPDTITFQVSDFRHAAAAAGRHRARESDRRHADVERGLDRRARPSARSIDPQWIRSHRG